MKRLVLTSSPVTLEERYGRFIMAASTEPSFGLVCLAAAAHEAGADVRIVESASNDLAPEAAAKEILGSAPDIVGISATTVGIVAAGKLAALLKASSPSLLIVAGGCHASALPEETLREFPAFDLLVCGEGERTLVNILGRHEPGGRPPYGLAGTAERDGDRIRCHPPAALISNLDELPLPAWKLLDGFPARFRPSQARIRRRPCASVVLTRGCPNQCTFCDRSVFGRRCRSYSPAYAVRLIRDLVENFGVRELLVEDDTFIIFKDHIREFCERLIADRIDLSWSCLGRADRVDPGLLRLMRKAGCWHISYGIESGSPAILRAVHKNLDLDQIRQAVAWSREAGLQTKGFFMVGFPNETRDTLDETRRFALSLPLHDITVMQLTPFPGSELYRDAAQYGEFDRDWRKMNTLTTVFVPKGLTRADLDQSRDRLLRSFYSRPSVVWRHAVNGLCHPRLLYGQAKGFLSLFRPSRNSP